MSSSIENIYDEDTCHECIVTVRGDQEFDEVFNERVCEKRKNHVFSYTIFFHHCDIFTNQRDNLPLSG